jgi:hypothetical protein
MKNSKRHVKDEKEASHFIPKVPYGNQQTVDTEDVDDVRHVMYDEEASLFRNTEASFYGGPTALTDAENTADEEDTDNNLETPSTLPALRLCNYIHETQTVYGVVTDTEDVDDVRHVMYEEETSLFSNTEADFNGGPPALNDAKNTDDESDDEEATGDSLNNLETPLTLPALCLRYLIHETQTLYGDPTILYDDEDRDDDTDDEEELADSINEFQHIHEYGLRGGHTGKRPEATIDIHLQLSNNNNNCFVNSVIQLLSASDYPAFLKTGIFNILVGTSPQSYTVTKLLASLYNTENRGHLSTAAVRRHVALTYGKFYLDLGSQQDAEEFLCALEETLSEELTALQEFRNLRSMHWGIKQTRRLFRDNTQNGTCSRCGLYPSIADEQFFILQLHIPKCASSVSLSSIIQGHFYESINTNKIRCPHCCPHDRVGQKCTHQGICRGRALFPERST